VRAALLPAAAVAAVALSGSPTPAPAATKPKPLRIPVAASGNVTIAQITLTPAPGAPANAKLTIVNGKALGANIAVLASTEPAKRGPRAVKPRKKKVNIIVVHRHRGRSRGLTGLDAIGGPLVAKFVLVRIPPGFTSTKPLVARNVVQDNPPPPFDCTPSAPTSGLYVGSALKGARVGRLGRSACLLSKDQAAPLAVAREIGADYCAVSTSPAGGGGLELSVAVGCSFGGLDFLELRFGRELAVVAQLPFRPAQCRAIASVQECAFPGGLRPNVVYRERILLDRVPARTDELVVRGSPDGGKTFTYRFAGGFPAAATPGS
jgi:hypothetical protein